MKTLNEILFEKINLLVEEFINNPQISAAQVGAEPKSALEDYISTSHLDDIIHNDLNYDKIRERKIIDGSISFAESNFNKNDYHKFLLELVKIFVECDKMDTAEEVLTNTIGKLSSDHLKAESLAILADIYIRKSKWDISIALINQAKDIYTKTNDIIGIVKCENLLGTSYGERGELLLSRNHFTNGLKFLAENPDEKLAAELETNLAIIENICGNFAKAKEHFYNALKMFEKIDESKRIAELRHNVGMLFLEQKEYEQAITEFENAIALSIKENFSAVLSVSYLGKATALTSLNDNELALEYCYKAMDMAIKIEDKLTIADVYKVIGTIERNQKRYESADKFLNISLRLNDELENRLNTAETLIEYSILSEKNGNSSQKTDWLKKALEYYAEVKAAGKVDMIEEMLAIA